MKPLLKISATLLLALMASVTHASAQIVTYDFPGLGNGTVPPPLAPTTVASGVSAGDLSVNTTSHFVGDSNGFVTGYQASSDQYATDLSGAVANNNYYTFSVAPAAGDTLTLTSLDLSPTSFLTQSGPASFAIESSVGGFSSTSELATFTPTNGNITVQGTDLSLDSSYANLTGPVEFRIYVYGSNDYFDVALQNSLSVDGTVSAPTTPEPSTYALLGLGVFALIFGLRQRRA
jgi:DUF4097 and DUF4098 domain-containing protein YvlB